MDCSTQASLSITNTQSLLKLMYIELVMPSTHLTLCRAEVLMLSAEELMLLNRGVREDS